MLAIIKYVQMFLLLRFAEPVGWLSKPDFKRKEQLVSNYKSDGTSK
jgi:hypothetical protein